MDQTRDYKGVKSKRAATRVKLKKKVKTHNWESGIDEYIIDASVDGKGCKLNTNLIYNIGDVILLNSYIDNKCLIGKIVRRNHKGYGIIIKAQLPNSLPSTFARRVL